MGKFKNTFVKEIRAEQERQREQERLRSKHHVDEKNILVVEKSNMVKFLIRTTGRIIRILATMTIFVLATIGLLALVYPEVRTELIHILGQIMADIQKMF